MKANAPYKIYISTNSQDGTYYISNQYKRLIEYTRTDAFIEKALKWFEQNLHMYNTAEALGDKQCFIEDFKKAML